jgi:hypothetical protein
MQRETGGDMSERRSLREKIASRCFVAIGADRCGVCCSYESLPPNFSLLQNMAAGAFAGIAVSNGRNWDAATV